MVPALQVSSGLTAWAVHALLIKTIYYLQHVSAAVPFLEVVAYAGYPFLYACLNVVVANLLGECTGGVCCITCSAVLQHQGRS